MFRFALLMMLLLSTLIHADPYQPIITEISEDQCKIQLDNGVIWRVSPGVFGFFDKRKEITSWEPGDEVSLFFCKTDSEDSLRAFFRLKNLRKNNGIHVNICTKSDWFSPYQIKDVYCEKGYLFWKFCAITLTDDSRWEIIPGYYHAANWEAGDRILVFPDTDSETPDSYVLINPDYYARHKDGFFSENFYFSCANAILKSISDP